MSLIVTSRLRANRVICVQHAHGPTAADVRIYR